MYIALTHLLLANRVFLFGLWKTYVIFFGKGSKSSTLNDKTKAKKSTGAIRFDALHIDLVPKWKIVSNRTISQFVLFHVVRFSHDFDSPLM